MNSNILNTSNERDKSSIKVEYLRRCAWNYAADFFVGDLITYGQHHITDVTNDLFDTVGFLQFLACVE